MNKKTIALLVLTALAIVVSPLTTHATDSDGDGISDSKDNCPSTYNPGQEDSDGQTIYPSCGDGICEGDETRCNCPDDCDSEVCFQMLAVCGNGFCEPFYSFGESHENCPQDCPPPTESDGYGDLCDNCPNDFNPDQFNADTDAAGDDCDNCPDTYNPSQTDSDGDSSGNACDPDCPNLDQLNPVHIIDFAILAADWQIAEVNLPADLDFNEVVDMNDLAIFSLYWLSDCYEE